MIYLVYVFVLNYFIYVIAKRKLKEKMPYLIILILGLFPFYLKYLVLFNATIFIVGVLIIILFYTITGSSNLERIVVSRRKELLLKLYVLLGKVLIWLMAVTFCVYLIVFVVTQLAVTLFPVNSIIEILKRKEFLNFFMILSIMIVSTYFIFRILVIIFTSLKENKEEIRSLEIFLFGISIFILVILPDFVFAFIYKSFAVPYDYSKSQYENSIFGVIKSFYFTFSLHYAMPMPDNTYSASIVKKISYSHELKLIQFGHIIISKIFDLIAIALVADFIKSRFFGEKKNDSVESVNLVKK
ncbi:hypothetical protein [Paenibacillus periandrae]|uniref:hypothetical protein n=1 Tax=Paenibacillus periandrae TaxID=1761741 RepID=UPI001F093BD2|nr:hypothetical protein [Paenibacillus periandrae]